MLGVYRNDIGGAQSRPRALQSGGTAPAVGASGLSIGEPHGRSAAGPSTPVPEGHRRSPEGQDRKQRGDRRTHEGDELHETHDDDADQSRDDEAHTSNRLRGHVGPSPILVSPNPFPATAGGESYLPAGNLKTRGRHR